MNRREFLVAAAALAIAPEALARELKGGPPAALVTADLESRLVVVSLTNGRPLRSITTLPDPRSIERVGSKVVVAHTAGAAVTILEGRTLEIRSVLRAFDEPRYTAASPDGRYAFVTDSGSQSVAVVDVIRGRVVRRLDVGGPARHISVDQKGRLWTALGTKAPRIAIADVRNPLRPQLLGRMRPPFLAHDVGFAPTGRVIWVTSGDRRELALFDPETARAVKRLVAGAPPQHVTFSGRLAFVTSGDDGTLHTQEAATGRRLRAARIPVGSYNVAEGFGLVFMPSLSQGTLCVADGKGRVTRSVRVARSSHDACFVTAA
jgi:DNA-binding beta-propeller fold protein YncE